MIRLLTLLMLVCTATPAFADAHPLFYTRETLTIQRKPESLPWQQAKPQPAPPESGVTFDVEVRDAQSYYNQEGWFNLSGPTDDSGVLLVFKQAAQSPIIASKQYAPLDILFLDTQGRITQVVPNILLSNLAQQIVPNNPVLAFLFLKGGICQTLNIKPGDVVDYKIFNKLPVVLGDPVSIVTTPQVPIIQSPQAGQRPAPRKVLMPASAIPPHGSPKLIPQLPPLPPQPTAPVSQEDPEMERALEKALAEKEPKR